MPHSSLPASAPHVVVLGAGFGGLAFARTFAAPGVRVTVVDRQNHHVFQPLLYQVATAGLAAPDIAQPIRSILRERPNLEVILADVKQIDLERKRVILDESELRYDYLVIALGGRTSYFGRDEWEQFAPGLKGLDDAMRLRRNMLLAYERAEREPDQRRRQELMTTVVVGGGAVGLTRGMTVETDRAGRILVRPDFSLPGHPEVFAIGDIAALTDANGSPVPGVAQGAIQAGAHVAGVVQQEFALGPQPPEKREVFRYHDKGNMATIGRSRAIAQVGRLRLSGYPAWLLWLVLHLVFLIGLRNRVSVFLQWTYAYFAYRRGARIILGLNSPPSS